MGEVFHLPAVRSRDAVSGGEQLVGLVGPHSSTVRWATMVTACGKRGPIRVREDLPDAQQPLLPADERVCPTCLVLWDYAEENGLLMHLYNDFGQSQWKASGAALCDRPMTCNRCRSPNTTQRQARPMACIVRDEAQEGAAA